MTEIRIDSFLAVLAFALIGAFAHWFKMKRAGRVGGTFFDYLVADFPGRSMATGFALVAATWLSVTSGAADLISPVLLWASLKAGVLNIASVNSAVTAIAVGYALDSGINKGGEQ
jgi:hypothetical protein